MTIAIRTENISKRYFLSHQNATKNESLKDELTNFLLHLRHRCAGRQLPIRAAEEFWALRDVSFEVRQGDRVGIIGSNGSGKSTLLKILSRITAPTSGRASIQGRVASLLEVGTGFHPDLTGRENIFLNGAVLGMKRQEIVRKFDEIAAFAEVQKFIDTPVKRYSSGMYMRLAFSIAAHLDPEVLIVDEVLAVGDISFQRKCLEKMKEVGRDGRTVLFVSHSIAAVQSLCNTALLLEKGSLVGSGDTNSVIQQYLQISEERLAIPLADRDDRRGSGHTRFAGLMLLNENGNVLSVCHSGQDIVLRMSFVMRAPEVTGRVVVAVGIDDEVGRRVAYLSNALTGDELPAGVALRDGVEVKIDKLPLVAGLYKITLYCEVNGEGADWIQDAATITVEPGDFFGTGGLPLISGQEKFLIRHRFQSQAVGPGIDS